MTAFVLGDRVVATVLPPGATEPIGLPGKVIGRATPIGRPPFYDVLTDDRTINNGVHNGMLAAALRRVTP